MCIGVYLGYHLFHWTYRQIYRASILQHSVHFSRSRNQRIVPCRVGISLGCTQENLVKSLGLHTACTQTQLIGKRLPFMRGVGTDLVFMCANNTRTDSVTLSFSGSSLTIWPCLRIWRPHLRRQIATHAKYWIRRSLTGGSEHLVRCFSLRQLSGS